MRESPRPILLDISRTVARSRLPAPTGIDRVERAYIRWAMARGAQFLAAFDGRQHLVDADTVHALLEWLEADGSKPGRDLKALMMPQRDANLKAAQSLVRRRAIASVRADELASLVQDRMQGAGIYLNVGHDNLSDTVMTALRDAGCKRVVLIHDTIPLDHPEFARAGSVEIFHTKLNAAFQADLLIANSQHTAGRLQALGASIPCITAPLGIEARAWPALETTPQPSTFLCLGTIEPRKNHALLLQIWQEFWDQSGDDGPKLILLGRRGWENQAVFDVLDTHPMMGRTVIEAGTPDDTALPQHFVSATALLFPSFAEGYGLPLAEALDAGLPCIASDLPALREVGGDAPEYLAPTDMNAWRAAILDHATPASLRRKAGLERMQHWTKPDWFAHFDCVENAIETILVQVQDDV